MRAVAPLLLLLISGVTAAPHFHAVVPDLPGPGPGDEGFAIATDVPFDLTDWFVTDGEGAWLAPEGTMLHPGEPLWLTGNLDAWQAHHGPPAVQWQDDNLRLSNDGERIELIAPNGTVADAFAWGTGTDSPYRSPGVVHRFDNGSWVTPRIHRIGESQLSAPLTWAVDAATLYASPDSSYEVLSQLIEDAQTRIALHVYALGHRELVAQIVAAAVRGVDVDVLVDGNVVGADSDDRALTAWLLNDLRDAGATVTISGNTVFRHHHLKVLVADDTTAVQSENWVPSGMPVDATYGNRGWGIALHDPELADWFAEWMEQDRSRWDVDPIPDRPAAPPPILPAGRTNYRPAAALFLEGPLSVTPLVSPDHTAAPGDALSRLLGAAEHRIWTQQLSMDTEESNAIGWSAPDRYLAAMRATDADVRVQLAAPFGYTDTRNTETIEVLRAAGVAAATWDHPQLGTLHNKGWIVDDAVVIGSMNAHHASRSNNREVMVVVESDAVAAYYAALFEEDWNVQRAWIPGAPVPILLVLMAVVVALRRC